MVEMKTLVDAFVVEMPAFKERSIEKISLEVPGYRAMIGDDVADRTIDGVNSHFLNALTGRVDEDSLDIETVAHELADEAVRSGVPLEMISSVFRIHQMVGWHEAMAIAESMNAPASVIAELAGAFMRFVDQFTTMTAARYALASSIAGATQQGARQRLLVSLLDGIAHEQDLSSLFAASDWARPEQVRVAIALEESVIWPSEALSGTLSGREVAIVSTEPGPKPYAAYGPRTPIDECAASLQGAREVAQLANFAPHSALIWDDHLATLIIRSAPSIASKLIERRLGRIDALPARKRAWMLPTLKAFLDLQGSPTRMANELNLHAQSIHYRISQLRGVVGDAVLEDPTARFELRMALAARDGGV